MNNTINNQSTIQPQPQNAPEIKVITRLDESEMMSLFLQKCRDHAIPISQPSPNLADLLQAVGEHLAMHRRRPTIEFPDGDKQWRAIQNDLSALHSSIEKILIHKLSARFTPKTETRSEPTAEPEQHPGERPSGHSTGHPPDTERTTPVQPPDTERSTADQHATSPRFDLDDLLHDVDDDDEELQQARAEYLAQLLRERTSRSPLDDLSPERQKILFELLEEHPKTIVLEMVCQPPPLGWGVQTSRPSLIRFCKRYTKQHRRAQHAEAAEEAEKIAQDSSATPQNFAEATRRLIQLRLFETAKDPKSNTDAMQFLCRYMDRQRRTDLSERRLHLSEQKSKDSK